MLISRLQLKNWRNFRIADAHLRDRAYIIGPNASGKSNVLDALRFLRDICKSEGGGFQKAVKDRGGVPKLRCLAARRDPEILIEIELSDAVDTAPTWRYSLGFRSEGKGQQRAIVSSEKVSDLTTGKVLLDRPNDENDRTDRERLTQTALEQISENQRFRVISDFLGSITYLHLVPQLLKFTDQLGGYKLESDPFGQAFLDRIAKVTEKTRNARLRKIEAALRVCVPNMRDLRFQRDELGAPHLEAMYKHWRPDAGWQREDQWSDGTLRLLGIMWSLLEGNSLLLLEEPELSLNDGVVSQIHGLIWTMQRSARYRRQVIITTHSEPLLRDKSIDPREIVRLEPSDDGTRMLAASPEELKLIEAGYSIAETVLPKTRPNSVDQLLLFAQ
jgi:predicted ATPase